ncbi:TIGR02099 family protein [Pseudomonas entomophila]|uniref:YhdP family protein n=1 Tax=Pseudomonas entomophila TaxID=312306 RepID=UPI0015E49001|nr:YhdP family protein [Pseudomonas entomophila]MBA1188575.1 TIGR02099 family protein [Pseudomonas entomophila]
MERSMRPFAALIRWALALCALFIVLVAVYASLGRALVPLVAEYRNLVEAKARQALGVPVRIGALEGQWQGLAPVLTLRDVQVGEGEQVLHLDQARVVPGLWASLLAREPRLSRLQVQGLHLGLREDANGRWSADGVPSREEAPSDPGQMLQRLRQLGRVDVLDSQLTLRPWQHAPLTLSYVNLGLQAAAPNQRLDVQANLPDGHPLSVSLRAQVDPDAWRDASFEAYVQLPQADWARWLPTHLLGDWHASTLQAGGEAWVEWRQGRLHSAVAKLAAPRLEGAHARQAPVAVQDVAVSAWVDRRDEGMRLTVDALTATVGQTPLSSRLLVRQQAGQQPADETWNIDIDTLPLAPLTPLVDALAPLPEAARTAIDALQVTGTLHNVKLQVRPKAEGAQRLSFAANLDRVGFDAYHGAPAAGNVSGSVQGDLGHGELRLDSDDFMLHLDPIFAKPWHYPKANARLTWQLDAQRFTLAAPYIKVLGDEGHIAADFLIRLHLDDHREDYMDLRVGLTDGDGRYTAKYLPQVLSPALDKWLRSAIVKGAVDEGYFQYQGSLSHAAPAHSRSISLFFKVHDATLDFQPGWPQVQQVDGQVFIENSSVRVKARRGMLLGTRVSDVSVDIPPAEGQQHSHLNLDGTFDGSLGDGLKILQEAPIGTGEIFAGWEGQGPLKGRVRLGIPLGGEQSPKVRVDFQTTDARLTVASPRLELSRLGGEFTFDLDKGLSGTDIRLRAFDRPVTATLAAEGAPGRLQTRIDAQGQVALKALTDWLQFEQPLPVSGEIPYRLRLDLGARNQLTVNSNLKGVTIDLPAPFGKATSTARDSTFGMSLDGAERRLEARYAGLATLVYAAPAERLLQGRGELRLGGAEALLPVEQGLRVAGRLDTLDIQAWQKALERAGTLDAAGSGTGGSSTNGLQQWLQSVHLSIGRLTAFGFDLNQAVVRLARLSRGWDLRLDSREVIGDAQLPDAKQAPMVVRLRTLRLPAGDETQDRAEDVPDPLASFDPRQAPMLDLSIDKLYRGDAFYGRWAMQLRPTAKGVDVNAIDLDLKGLRIEGQAAWEGTPGATTSAFKGRLHGGDLGAVLKAWGFAPTVTSRAFRVDADGRWPGSPAWIALKRFSGSLDASLRDGQFVEIEGGAQALRVFGLLNFNAIGRRLRLDFSDLLGKGLAYDRVKGLLMASEGVYVTREPISVTSPSSNLDLEGTLDLARERVVANLRVSLPVTDNLPLAAILVGAPVVGGALFLVDQLIGDKVSRFASVNYHVVGPLKAPRITFVKPFQRPRKER